MNGKQLGIAAAVAGVALIGAGWLTLHRSASQEISGGKVFADLAAELPKVSEVHLSKGDGGKLTLRLGEGGWQVAERNYPADPTRVRDFLRGLANLDIIELKTRDPANYAKLGVEPADRPTSQSTLVEVVAGEKKWALLVGRNANGKSIYVRKPSDEASAEVSPVLVADPDPKRWLDRQIVEVDGKQVVEIQVAPQGGASYLLTRPGREAADLALTAVPAGRTALAAPALNSQADVLTSLNFDDVQPLPATPAAATDHTEVRTLDGVIFDIAGRKDGERHLITVKVKRDAALAARYAPNPAAGPIAADGMAPASLIPETAPVLDEKALAALSSRAQGVEYEIPAYKYGALFKPLETLLEPKPEPVAKQKK